MKKLLSILTIIICCVAVTITVFAHPGSTDADGGHYVRDTGEYHYHHGYPAHYHANGVCPYNFDFKPNTSSNSNKSTNNQKNPAQYLIENGSVFKLNESTGEYEFYHKIGDGPPKVKTATSSYTGNSPLAISLIRSVFYSLTLSILLTYIYGFITQKIIAAKCGIKEAPKKIRVFLTQKPMVIVYICISIASFIILSVSNVTAFWYSSLHDTIDVVSRCIEILLLIPVATFYITKLFLSMAHCNFFCDFRGKTFLFVLLGIITALTSADILILLFVLIFS